MLHCSGPSEVAKMQDEGVVVVRDTEDKSLGLRHPAIAVEHTKPYKSREHINKKPELAVSEILDHRRRRRRDEFMVKWSTGEESWQPEYDLVDYSADKEEPAVVNEALLRYVASIPSLNARFRKRWRLSENGGALEGNSFIVPGTVQEVQTEGTATERWFGAGTDYERKNQFLVLAGI